MVQAACAGTVLALSSVCGAQRVIYEQQRKRALELHSIESVDNAVQQVSSCRGHSMLTAICFCVPGLCPLAVGSTAQSANCIAQGGACTGTHVLLHQAWWSLLTGQHTSVVRVLGFRLSLC